MNDSIQVITPYILKKKSIKKVKYNSFTKDYIILDSLVNDLKSFLDDFIPKTISLEISNNTKEVFNYYLKNKVEEVLLFFTEENNNYNFRFKVCPSYLNSNQRILLIDKYLKNNTKILSLKDFYLKSLKKYII